MSFSEPLARSESSTLNTTNPRSASEQHITTPLYQSHHQRTKLFQRWLKVLQSAWQRDRVDQWEVSANTVQCWPNTQQHLYPQRTELRGVQILSVIMCHGRGQSRFVNREPGCWGARVGKPDQIGEIQVISGMLKLFRHYVSAHAWAFHKAGSDMDKALDPVLFFIHGTTKLFKFVKKSVTISYLATDQCHFNLPWQGLKTDFLEFETGHGWDRSMPYMFGDMCFRKFKLWI